MLKKMVNEVEFKVDLALIFCFLLIVCLPIVILIACCNQAIKGKMDFFPKKKNSTH